MRIDSEQSVAAPKARLSFYSECEMLRVCGEANHLVVSPPHVYPDSASLRLAEAFSLRLCA